MEEHPLKHLLQLSLGYGCAEKVLPTVWITKVQHLPRKYKGSENAAQSQLTDKSCFEIVRKIRRLDLFNIHMLGMIREQILN